MHVAAFAPENWWNFARKHRQAVGCGEKTLTASAQISLTGVGKCDHYDDQISSWTARVFGQFPRICFFLEDFNHDFSLKFQRRLCKIIKAVWGTLSVWLLSNLDVLRGWRRRRIASPHPFSWLTCVYFSNSLHKRKLLINWSTLVGVSAGSIDSVGPRMAEEWEGGWRRGADDCFDRFILTYIGNYGTIGSDAIFWPFDLKMFVLVVFDIKSILKLYKKKRTPTPEYIRQTSSSSLVYEWVSTCAWGGFDEYLTEERVLACFRLFRHARIVIIIKVER